MILEGIGKMLLSVGQGVFKLLDGMFDGLGELIGYKGDNDRSDQRFVRQFGPEKTAKLSATGKAI
jgi:hypothetical protein